MLPFTGSQRVGHNLVTKQQAQWGFPGDSVVKNPLPMQMWVLFLSGENPLEEDIATHSSTLA